MAKPDTLKPRHVAQIPLVAAITEHLRKEHRIVHVEARHLNAIIRAADLVVAEFGRATVPATPGMGLVAWAKCDETGESSVAMAAHLEGPFFGGGVRPYLFTGRYNGKAVPLDAADFGRCVKLLEAEPGLREHLPKMAAVSPAWARLVERWGEIEATYREELPLGRAPRTCEMIRRAIEGEVANV